MTFHKNRDPELLPGANQDEDCQPETVPVEVAPDENHDEAHEHDVTWDELESGAAGSEQTLLDWRRKQSGWAHALERVALAVEKPVNKLIGNNRLNPFYHTGPIAIFLLMVVAGTGTYLFLFFHYGFNESYEAVVLFNQQFIARTMRAAHRYASGALVITTLLHAYRILFMERFRGSRWLAWVTGIVLTAVIWLAGVTGYWLIWDARAQLINDSFINLLQRFTPWAAPYAAKLVEVAQTGDSWPVLLTILAVHVLLTVIAAGFFWLHVRRLKRAKWFPETHWLAGITALLILVAIAFPLTVLPQANPAQLPQGVHLDPIFLFFLPVAGRGTAVILWTVLIGVTALAVALPWITRDKSANPAAPQAEIPKVNIIKERCTGCTKCALDCPYGAIVMVARHDDKPHKFIAIEDPNLCVSCGICVGSCDGVAVTLGEMPPALLWDEVSLRLTLAKAKAPDQPIKLVFTCDRHAAHGARPFLPAGNGAVLTKTGAALEVVVLPCVGTLPPDLLVRSLAAGAADIQVIGCPPDDCSNREGNLWEAQRLLRQRVPRLKKSYADAPITAVWQPPNQFAQALEIPLVLKANEAGELEPNYPASRRFLTRLTWRNYMVSFGLLAVVLVAQIFLTDIFMGTAATESPRIQIVLPTTTKEENASAFAIPGSFKQLVVEVDGEIVHQESIADADPVFVEELTTLGEHHVRVYLTADSLSSSIIFADQVKDFEAGNVLRVERPLVYPDSQ